MYSLVLATMVTVGGEAPSHWWGGCWGSCYGCYGNAFSSYAPYNAFSGCLGWGCYGGCYGWGCYGACYGCGGCYGYGYSWASRAAGWGYGWGCPPGLVIVSPMPAGERKPEGPAPPKKPGEEGRRGDPPAPARVTIVLPEGGRLFVNDQPVEVNPAARTFDTPDLKPGQAYHYIFKAEVKRDGQMMRDTQQVEVAAGRHVTVEFKGLPNVAAARR
jgi:uncharacterized protein (TIGR03000 family)